MIESKFSILKIKDKLVKIIKICRNSGSNQGPLDLQSNALPTELFRLIVEGKLTYFLILFRMSLYIEWAIIVIKINILIKI